MPPLEQAALRGYAGEPGLTDRAVDAASGALIPHVRALEREDVPDLPLLVRGPTRLRKSVTFWSRRDGRQGSLNAMSELVPRGPLPPTGRRR